MFALADLIRAIVKGANDLGQVKPTKRKRPVKD